MLLIATQLMNIKLDCHAILQIARKDGFYRAAQFAATEQFCQRSRKARRMIKPSPPIRNCHGIAHTPAEMLKELPKGQEISPMCENYWIKQAVASRRHKN